MMEPLYKDGEVVGLVNLPLQTIFRQVDVTFQQTQVSHTGTNYPYKAYIDTILKTNLSTQENLLTSQLFYKDKGPDTNDAKTGSNRGLFERAVVAIGGRIVDLEGPLFLDLFEQSRLLVNGVSIGIKLWPSQDAFRLITDSLTPNQKACQCDGIKHLVKYGFNAISHICIQWSMTLVYVSSCELARAI